MTTASAGTSTLRQVGRALVLVLAIAVPLVVAWLGIRLLVPHLESQVPDGDLEPGGYFATSVLLVGLVALNYLASGALWLVLARRVGSRPGPVLLIALGASIVVTTIGVARSWT